MRKKNQDEFEKDDFDSEEESEKDEFASEEDEEKSEDAEVVEPDTVEAEVEVVQEILVEKAPIEDDWSDNSEREGWMIIGWAADRTSANFVVETLKSYDIQSVVESKSGFLGDVGLTLNPQFEDAHGAYEVWAPEESAEEAVGLAEMVGGDKWESADVE